MKRQTPGGRKYLQTIPLTKDSYLKFRKNSQNSIGKYPTNDLIRMWVKDTRRHFTKEDMQKAHKH